MWAAASAVALPRRCPSGYPVAHVRTTSPSLPLATTWPTTSASPTRPPVIPRYNVAPTQPVLAVGLSRDGRPAAATFRWGIIPPWSADPKPGPINARGDGRRTSRRSRRRSAGGAAYPGRRVLRVGGAAGPAQAAVAFPPVGRRAVRLRGAVGGLAAGAGPPLLTCALLTTAANELVRPIHGRMPVIIHPHEYSVLDGPGEGRTGGAAAAAAADGRRER